MAETIVWMSVTQFVLNLMFIWQIRDLGKRISRMDKFLGTPPR